jgi:hypothetical protein
MLQLFSSPWLQLAVTPVTHQRDAAAGSAWQRHLNSGGCRVLALSRDLWPCKSTHKQYNSGEFKAEKFERDRITADPICLVVRECDGTEKVVEINEDMGSKQSWRNGV